ncbi:glucan phosphoethanolaminetransferase (alkaline phosphatase superfamily) [Paenibacillus sp. DS2015]
MIWVIVFLFLLVTTLGFIVMYKLIGLIPKVNKVTASIISIILIGIFTYEWINNISNQLFVPMP